MNKLKRLFIEFAMSIAGIGTSSIGELPGAKQPTVDKFPQPAHFDSLSGDGDLGILSLARDNYNNALNASNEGRDEDAKIYLKEALKDFPVILNHDSDLANKIKSLRINLY